MNTLKAAGITAMAFAVLSCSQLRAQWNTTPYVPVHNNLYTATGNLWRTDHSFQSTIHLTNRLITQPMDVTVTLYMADGTPYVLPVAHLAKSGVAEVSVNAALASVPAAVLSHLSQSGSATLQYRYDWAGAVRGSTTILDSVRSLQYTNSFRFPETAMNSGSPGAAAMTGPHVLQGLWWKYSPQSSVFVSAANTTGQQMQATIAVVDQQQNALGTRQIVLGPQASTLTTLDDIIGSSPSTLIGGVRITYSGNPGALLFSGGLEDDAAGYSATVPLGMAMMPMTTTSATPNSCTVAAAGLMVGPAGAMMGFPSGVTFHPYGFARNIGTAPLTLHSSVNYMDSSGPHTLALPDQTLAAGQALNLQLSSATQLLATVGSVNLSFSFAGDCSSLLLATGSVDTTGNYVFEVAPTGVAPGNGRQLLHWQVGNGYDSMFSLWNPSSQAEDLVATVYFEPEESTYTVPITLAPNASAMLDIMELIEAAKPDVNGNTIPSGAHVGSVVVTGTSPDLRDTVTFVAAGGVYNPLSGTCGIICTDCTGAVSGDLSPASPSVAAGHTQAFTFNVNNSNGTQTNYTTTATWSSSETSVATVSSGQASAVSSGSTEISAISPSIPAGTGQSCIDGDEVLSSCESAQYSGATTLTVYDDTPSSISVSPSSYTVGTATGFTITGQNLGTNCPQLTWPFKASYSLSSCGNTSVSGTVTASAAGSGDLTFKAEGYGGEGFSPGPGQSQTAQSATVSANVQFQFAVTGASFIFVGSDSHVVSSNAYFASNGAGGFPQPTGGTFSASSSDGSDQVSASQSPPEVKFTTADQSKSSGDRKLTFTYAAGGQQTSQSMNVTARQFAYATNTASSNSCALAYGTNIAYTYTIYTHPDGSAATTQSLQSTAATESFNPQPSCGQITSNGALNANIELVDNIGSVCSANQAALTCRDHLTQTISVGGFAVRTNNLVWGPSGVTYTSNGPTN